MKNSYLLGFTLLAGCLISSVAQAAGWDVKGLDVVTVDFVQSQGSPVISPSAADQLVTDTKLKLKSAGLTLASPQDAKAAVVISVKAIKGIMNEWVEVQLTVLESVRTDDRKVAQKADAVTYLDQAFFETPISAANQKIYGATLNGLVTKFVGQYLDQNSK